MSKTVTPIFEANMDAALRSHYRRTGADAIDPGPMPYERMMTFEQALEAEDDGIQNAEGENTVGQYEMLQRVMGARALLRLIKRRGVTMPQIMRELFAVGRAVQDPFFSSLTMTEAGLMFSETKAAHSWRVGVLSGMIKLEGMKGYRLPGQKTPEAKATYAASAKRTCNRRGGTKQGSFLRSLKTKKENAQRPTPNAQRPTQKQGSFIRKLSGGGSNGTAHTSQPAAPRAGSAPPTFRSAGDGHRPPLQQGVA